MKTLNDLKLRKKTEKKVEEWLQEWINHFITLADGREGNVYRANFEKMDLFFFTECNDLVSKDIESTGNEKNMEIRRRKRMVVLQLLLKTMKGEKIGRKIKCSHCGFGDVYIGSRPSGGGHYMFCEKCCKTDVCTYPDFYDTTMDEVKSELVKKGFFTVRK